MLYGLKFTVMCQLNWNDQTTLGSRKRIYELLRALNPFIVRDQPSDQQYRGLQPAWQSSH